MLFGFMALGVKKFGWLSCYSAYGPKWGEYTPKLGRFNLWTFVTLFSALLLAPVLLEQAKGSEVQFLGFLPVISLALVATTPDYQTNKFAWWCHQIGAWGAVLVIIGYNVAHNPTMLWVLVPLILVALMFGIWKKGTMLFWLEIAVYLMAYVIMFAGVRI